MVSRKLSRFKYFRVTKYILTAAWVGAIVAAAIAAGGYHSIDLLYNTESGVSIDAAMGWIFWGMIVLIILLPAFLMGKRAFCYYFCPWGVLNMLGTKIRNILHLPSLHLEVSQNVCKNCHTCSTNCPMSLPVAEMVKSGSMKNDECILCGTCADNCPNSAIQYSWRKVH